MNHFINEYIQIIKELNDNENTFVKVCCNKVIDYDKDIKIIDYNKNAYSYKNDNDNINYDCGQQLVDIKVDISL